MITDAEFDAFLRETLSESQLTPEVVNVFYNYILTYNNNPNTGIVWHLNGKELSG